MRGYTIDVKKEKKITKAYGKEYPISPKKAYEVCNKLRGMPYNDAKMLLEGVINKKIAIPIRRYNQETAHKKGVGPGRYPVKVAKYILKLFKNLESNAKEDGIDLENAYIYVIAASRGRIKKWRMPRAYGISTAWNEQTTNIEVILKERKEKKASENKVSGA